MAGGAAGGCEALRSLVPGVWSAVVEQGQERMGMRCRKLTSRVAAGGCGPDQVGKPVVILIPL